MSGWYRLVLSSFLSGLHAASDLQQIQISGWKQECDCSLGWRRIKCTHEETGTKQREGRPRLYDSSGRERSDLSHFIRYTLVCAVPPSPRGALLDRDLRAWRSLESRELIHMPQKPVWDSLTSVSGKSASEDGALWSWMDQHAQVDCGASTCSEENPPVIPGRMDPRLPDLYTKLCRNRDSSDLLWSSSGGSEWTSASVSGFEPFIFSL